jgi:hypothetical protein
VVDAIAAQAMARGAKVLAVRGKTDLAGAPLAAIIRYPVGARAG